MVSSMSGARTVSTLTRDVSTLVSRTVAAAMMPVSPMPPAVAQNSSGSAPGVTRRSRPSASSRSKEGTCRAKLPATWWFLPCTSAAIAPPTVTCRVPGETGTNHPRGRAAVISCSRLTPASQVTRPASVSNSVIRFIRVVMMTRPPPFCAALL